MVEWSIASDLKSDERNPLREFESHSLLLEKRKLLSQLKHKFVANQLLKCRY